MTMLCEIQGKRIYMSPLQFFNILSMKQTVYQTMTTKEAIVATLGKESLDGMIEAGCSDLSVLENACLTAFLGNIQTQVTETLRNALSDVWNKPPGTFRL